MVAVQSKEAGNEEQKRQTITREEQKRQIQMMLYHISLNVTALTMPGQFFPRVVANYSYAGESARAMEFLGSCSAGCAIF